MFMASSTSEDLNALCNLMLDGDFGAPAKLFLRTFNVEEFPMIIEFEEPQGGDQNHAAIADNANDVKDAATVGSIYLDAFVEESEGVASSLVITQMAEGTGEFTAASIKACYCPGLIAARMYWSE